MGDWIRVPQWSDGHPASVGPHATIDAGSLRHGGPRAPAALGRLCLEPRALGPRWCSGDPRICSLLADNSCTHPPGHDRCASRARDLGHVVAVVAFHAGAILAARSVGWGGMRDGIGHEIRLADACSRAGRARPGLGDAWPTLEPRRARTLGDGGRGRSRCRGPRECLGVLRFPLWRHSRRGGAALGAHTAGARACVGGHSVPAGLEGASRGLPLRPRLPRRPRD